MGGPGAFAAALACSLLAVTSGFTTPMPPSVNSSDGNASYSNGTKGLEPEHRIAHGWFAGPGQYPYHAAISIGPYPITCGGTLVNARWVVSAAHCLEIQVSVQIGLGVTRTDIEESYSVWLPADRVVLNPEFNTYDPDTPGDLALVHLPVPVTFNQYIYPLRLPDAGEEIVSRHNGLKGQLCGFGATSMTGPAPITHLKCGYMLVRSPCIHPVSHKMFCGAVPDTKDSSCPVYAMLQGDSGGGFVLAITNTPALHGVVTNGWCDGVRDSTFLRISTYLPWINQYVNT